MDKEAVKLAAEVRAKRHMALIFYSDPEAVEEFKQALSAFRQHMDKRRRIKK